MRLIARLCRTNRRGWPSENLWQFVAVIAGCFQLWGCIRFSTNDHLQLATIAGDYWFAKQVCALLLPRASMRTRMLTSFIWGVSSLALFAAQNSVRADIFGTSGNEFTIEFVDVGNAGNAADTNGYGGIPYSFRIGKYEISQETITKATASGLGNVAAGAWTGNQPAANISWYEAAAFVNWLNTSMGKQAAYDLAWNGSAWSMNLWSSADSWQAGGENLFRHKDAYYFLPSETEWYKAAYYNAAGANYFRYPTGSNTAPTAVAGGTNSGTAVYAGVGSAPASVTNAGGVSPYGTMGQGGNVWDWMESAFDGSNNSASEARIIRGGSWGNPNYSEFYLRSSGRSEILVAQPWGEINSIGFRVASVPEPSTYALLAMSAAGALWWARRRK